MKNYIKLLSLLLLLIMLVQSTVFSALAITPIDVSVDVLNATGQPSKYSSQYNSGQRDVIATTLNGTSADAYYNGSNEYDVLSEKSANEIKTALSSLMKSTHTYVSSYDDCHYKAHRTDCENEQGSSNKLSLIYTSYTATQSQWNGWNREHVWPKSLGGNNTTGGGADMHHIRPSDAVVNSTRGNKKYGEASSGKAVYGSNPATGVLGGYSSTYFEPLDNVKGDVARICLYVWIRWGSAWGADSITEVFQSVDVLLAWMELDPVDTWELGRNEVIEDIQGNRNVFIDYPEYAWLIFDKEVPSDMVTPSGEAKSNAHHYDNGTITTQPTCTTTGVKTYTCTDSGCGATKTETLAKLGHSLGNWIIDKEATETNTGSKHRDCSRCGYTETVTIPLVGHTHSYSSTVTPPTCSEKGYTTHTCACGEYYIDSYTNTVAHTFVGISCSVCGAKNPNAPTYTKEDFSDLISSIISGRYMGQSKYNKICEAISIYNTFSTEDKESLSAKYNILVSIATQYNEEIKTINEDASVLDNIFVAVSFSGVSFAAFTLLKKKEF